MVNRRIIIATLALLVAGSAFAQLPPGRWWHRPEVVSTLSLTEDQQSKLDAIFASAANDLIDAKADVDKAEVALRSELDQPQLNRANIQKIAARLNEARNRRFSRELMMLVDMRGVLSDQQWTRMRTTLDRMQERQQQRTQGQQQPRPRMRPQ
jgi:hypothetical protein